MKGPKSWSDESAMIAGFVVMIVVVIISISPDKTLGALLRLFGI